MAAVVSSEISIRSATVIVRRRFGSAFILEIKENEKSAVIVLDGGDWNLLIDEMIRLRNLPNQEAITR